MRRRFDWEKRKAAAPNDLVIRSSLPRWIKTALRQSGIKRMSMLSVLSDEQLLEIPGIGRRSAALIRQELLHFFATHRQDRRGAGDQLNAETSAQPEDKA
ncbi:hypothetical protein CO657_36515 (plasmid) [Rhizobium acidisoli]|uniref:Uncharacterized protein n=1 Tax=Rhizobium acidisoli TaxID=1538158 RepID=A0AAE6C602_9HYPH|nr:hypothetical protein [Rhizobium acidisoli]QAS83251.1 hypothetical protein CO657_36515 [Rhizobium acidisoli]